jgi:hypothetical protein
VNEQEDLKGIFSIFGTDIIEDSDLISSDNGDIIYEGALVPDDCEITIDYGNLTDEEIKELQAIYDRYEAIFNEIVPDGSEDISDAEFDALMQKYADELEKLDKRAAELEEKAGWFDVLGNFDGVLDDLFDEDFFCDLIKDLDIDPDADFDSITADQVVDIAGKIVDHLDAEKITGLIKGIDGSENIDSATIDDTLAELKKVVVSDEFKNLVGDLLDVFSSIDIEF